MTRIFVELPIFRSRWKSLGLNDSDLRRLQEELLADPKIGDVMRKTGGIRKMRFAFEKKGKSGSVRVIYVDFEVYEKIFLLTAYAKNEKDNLSDAECNELKQLIKMLEDQLKENTVYQGMLEKISKYEEQVQTMGLSKEKRKTIDAYVTEVSERWILYAESLYQAGMQKILELLNL